MVRRPEEQPARLLTRIGRRPLCPWTALCAVCIITASPQPGGGGTARASACPAAGGRAPQGARSPAAATRSAARGPGRCRHAQLGERAVARVRARVGLAHAVQDEVGVQARPRAAARQRRAQVRPQRAGHAPVVRRALHRQRVRGAAVLAHAHEEAPARARRPAFAPQHVSPGLSA